MNWESFHFIRPLWLLALLPVVALIWLWMRRTSGESVWRKVVDSHLLPHLLSVSPVKQGYSATVLLGTGWFITVLALAGPTWSRIPQPVYRADISRVLVLDLSQSMDAPDLKPSRLTRAKHKILDFLEQNREGQVGLIVYAAEPYVVSPLTEDGDTIAAMVPTLKTDLMPVQGSRLSAALQKAGQILAQAGVPHGEIIIITDEVRDQAAIEAARILHENGRKISVLGVGTTEGAPIPMKNGGFMKDSSGAIVIPRFDPAQLEQLASAGGGAYHQLTVDDRDLKAVLTASASKRIDTAVEKSQRTTDVWREEGPWLLVVLLPLAALAFRRGWLGIIALLFFLPVPHSAYAFGWDDLWLRKDQQAAEQMAEDKPAQAAELFQDPAWKGTASYRAGKYEQAVQEFSQVDTPEANYNKGNALARLGKLQEAIDAYNQALKQDPKHQDAQHNKKIVEELLKKQQQNQQNQGQQNSPQDSQNKNSQNQNAQNKNSGNKNSQDKNAQNNTGKNSDQNAGNQNTSNKNQQQAADTQQNNEQQNSSQQAGNQNQRENQQAQKNSTSQNSASKDQQSDQNSVAQQNQTEQDAQENVQHQANATDTQQKNAANPEKSPMSEEDPAKKEAMQAMEQWLGKIPDDPGGLLRQKFLLEHLRRRNQQRKTGKEW
jgi:Ca-activated chloride channel family protein